jgi:peptidoglycan/xylan/chitin deacetylase (PgdA/CDA1 family)
MECHLPKTDSELHVVMYHYVRDLPNTRFPRIKGLMLDEFREQIRYLAARYEMATLRTALEFVDGTYCPRKDLCILTFDDGLKEHYTDVAPILYEHDIQGLFGVITSGVEDHVVAPVHMNHFLMAELGFEHYRSAFMQLLVETGSQALLSAVFDPNEAQKSYPLDRKEVAIFKFLFNFTLDPAVRDKIVEKLFAQHLGSQEAFAAELYMSWEEIRQLQGADMLIAGHTHWHRPLSTLNDAELNTDLCISRSLFDQNLDPQELWPFSYPYGKQNSYSELAISLLRQLGYSCAFNTEDGVNKSGSARFELRRIDCNGIRQLQA